jgi:hypothetical protein
MTSATDCRAAWRPPLYSRVPLKVRERMVRLGWCSLDAGDSVFEAAWRGFCAARGLPAIPIHAEAWILASLPQPEGFAADRAAAQFEPPAEFASEGLRVSANDAAAKRRFWEAFEAAAGQLCRAASPHDLPADVAFYAVHAFELGAAAPDYIDAGRMRAYTRVGLDLELRRPLESLRRWTRRGVAMLIGWTEPFVDFGLGLKTWRAMIGLALHEYAHTLVEPLSSYRNADAIDRRAAAAAPTVSEAQDLEQHGLQFLRALLHLHTRAARLGVDVKLDHLHAWGSRYRHAGPAVYQNVLGEELRESTPALPIRWILANPPPKLAAAQFEFDLFRRRLGAQ